MAQRDGTQEQAEWPAQWLRGPLPLCALSIIAQHPNLHGYAITQHLADAGLGKIGGGTLYPLLGRFERDGVVTTDWVAGSNGPAKKVYAITALGEERLASDSSKWSRFASAATSLITREGVQV